jgi:hypothetical protein
MLIPQRIELKAALPLRHSLAAIGTRGDRRIPAF